MVQQTPAVPKDVPVPPAPSTHRPVVDPQPAPPDLDFPSSPDLDPGAPDLDFPSPPDLGDEDAADFNAWCDALRASAVDHMAQHLPWERSWTPADAANDATVAGEVA